MHQARLWGSVMIVSSGARPGGCGQAIARRLAGEGAKIVLVDRDPRVLLFAEELQQSESIGAVGGNVIAIVGDLAIPDTARRAVAACIKAFGTVTCVLNVAGGSDPSVPATFDKTSPDHYRQLFDLNFATAVNLTTAALPTIKASGGRRAVIFFSTTNGTSGWAWAGEPALAAAKAGIEAITGILAAELRPCGIAVNCLRLASVPNPHSPTWRKRLEDPRVLARMRELYGEHGPLTAEQVAEEVVHILDPRSPWRTGQVIVLDPGGIGTLGTEQPRPSGDWWTPAATEHDGEPSRRWFTRTVSRLNGFFWGFFA